MVHTMVEAAEKLYFSAQIRVADSSGRVKAAALGTMFWLPGRLVMWASRSGHIVLGAVHQEQRVRAEVQGVTVPEQGGVEEEEVRAAASVSAQHEE